MPPARFERTTPGLGIRCSILLSYGGAAPKMTQSRHGNKGDGEHHLATVFPVSSSLPVFYTLHLHSSVRVRPMRGR